MARKPKHMLVGITGIACKVILLAFRACFGY